MKGKLNLKNKSKNCESNQYNLFYSSNKTNNDVYLNIPYDENTFYDDYNIPNAFNDNTQLNDMTDDFYNKIQKKILHYHDYQNDLENDCSTTDTSILVNYF